MSIVIKELEESPSRKVKITAPDGRETLYKKIIDKTLKKYDIEKDIKINKSKNDKNDVKHHFLLESNEIIFIELVSNEKI